jgi:hypothetical protein
VHASSSRATLAGRVRSQEWRVEADGVELRVERHELPALASWLLPAGALLERAQRDLVADEGGTALRERESAFAGHPARELHYRVSAQGGRNGRALFVLADARLWLVAALYPEGAAAAQRVERFFASFAFSEPAGP